ncbi:cellulose synthase subunit BcsC-related outer membrane protein [Sodalis sp. RH14]|uniref:cellulose synthase subunit BcsC-related outer membrane protein n=1 Tax=Sodalis sp. RH14 TaxID=3394329 RepID=UPI0039B4894D
MMVLGVALSLAVMPPVRAEPPPAIAPEQWLLAQVRLGEANHQDQLVRQSLDRLALIAPDSPQVLAAQLRLDLREGNQDQARERLEKIQRLAPDSTEFRQARLSLELARPETQQRLQQARLLATAGRLAEARALYDQVFGGQPPPVELALEYWQLVARVPGHQDEAERQLADLDRQYPGNVALRLQLAQYAFAAGRNEQAIGWLRQVANTPAGRQPAAEMWLARIKATPVDAQSVSALQFYLRVFNDGASADAAQQELRRRQALLADPRYQARMEGLAKIEQGASSGAIAPLTEALAATPDDAQVLGAMGLAYARSGQRLRALDYFTRAQQAEQNGFNGAKWRGLIQTNRYWWALEQGDRALKSGHLAEADGYYRQARGIDDRDAWAWVGLGDVAVARDNDSAAEYDYRRALALEHDNGSAQRGLVNLYQRRSPQLALDYLGQLPPGQRQKLRDKQLAIQLTLLTDQGGRDAGAGHWAQAAQRYRQALDLEPGAIWTAYHYAQALRHTARVSEADTLMAALARRYPGDPAQVYAYALYLAGSGRDDAALTHLRGLPSGQWSEGMRQLAQRLEWEKRAEDIDRRLDVIERRLADGDPAGARGALQYLRSTTDGLSLYQQRRIAMAWLDAGDAAQAAAGLRQLKKRVQTAPNGQDKTLIYRDLARVEQRGGQPEAARADYQSAMQAAGLSAGVPANNDEYTRLTRHNPGDDWLRRGIRADAGGLYRQQDVNFTLDHDFWSDGGTPGKSDLSANTTMLQADMPWDQGRAFGRADIVRMDAGTLANDYGGTFGTCADLPCHGNRRQTATGVSLGAGWENDQWKTDIGTTPLGFPVVDWVGGVAYRGDWRSLGWTATASRRPVSSSLLSFAGARDPGTGMTWGGVRATGGGLGLSYDQGNANGLWGDLSAHQLTGKNVADNSRERLMGGYYYKVINEEDRRATVGLNSMLWHYRRDLSGYTLGQGGYYSPQRYFSLAVPVNYRARAENVSWQLGASLSWSHASTGERRRYPLAGVGAADILSSGGDSSGFGYTVQALIERRLSSHWTLGAGIDIQQAKDYTPSHILAYLRYSMAGWQGDLAMPPQPLNPYADFK